MKKLLSLILAVIAAVSLFAFAGCADAKSGKNGSDEADKGTLTIAVPDGAPVLALYSLMAGDGKIAGYNVELSVLSGAANIGTTLVNGDADCAVMPVNVAAKLYNKGTQLKLLSVNVFGVLYMVGKEDITTYDDLLGKVVLNIGRGGTPDISLKKILDGNDIAYEDSETAIEGKVALNYVSDASEVIAMLKAGRADYGILGEPAASKACKATGSKIVMDIQGEWNKLVGEGTFTQAGFVLGKNVLADEELAAALLEALSANAELIVSEYDKVNAVITEKGSSLNMDFTAELLARCNLGCKRSSVIKEDLEKYFEAVKAYDATFIGGKLPDDGFYY